MIYDLRQLIIELKKKNTRVTLITLISSPKLPKLKRLLIRMDIFNKAILDYACGNNIFFHKIFSLLNPFSDDELKCNVIDMHTIFLNEEENFRRD